jgi:pimeloyl-ACP methyl ester carboxylesterase
MKKIFSVIAAVLLVSAAAAQSCTPQGNWLGNLNAGGMTLRIGMHLDCEKADCKGYITSPDQTRDSFNIDKMVFSGDTLLVRCKMLGMRYTATFNRTCDTLSGIWVQGQSLPIRMYRVEKLPRMERPQEPKPPYPYSEREVLINNRKSGNNLAGTLTIPQGKGPFPAVVLITGSGPQDRNEELLGHKPFLVIADYLTRNGIAVLRYDDRGVGASGGDFKSATSFDFAEDANAAFEFLRTQEKINPEKVGLMGHSEGGMIAPIVASKNSKVDFIVLLAGPGVSGRRILLSQAELIAKADSMPEQEIKDNIAVSSKIYDLIEKEKDLKKLAPLVREELKKLAAAMTDEERREANLSDAGINSMVISVCSPWFANFVKFDPQVYLKKVSCPVLALNGEKDLQVPCSENLNAIETALRNGKCRDYTVKALPGLNHLFQNCTTCRIGEYAQISETFSPQALQIVRDWILEH